MCSLLDYMANWTSLSNPTNTAIESAVTAFVNFSFFTFVLKTGPGSEQLCQKFLILNPEKSNRHIIISADLLI